MRGYTPKGDEVPLVLCNKPAAPERSVIRIWFTGHRRRRCLVYVSL